MMSLPPWLRGGLNAEADFLAMAGLAVGLEGAVVLGVGASRSSTCWGGSAFVGFTELTCLGHTVNEHGRRPDTKKTIAISALKDPSNVSELATFLGMTNFYSEYVPHYAAVTYPLNELRKSGAEWVFTDQHRAAVVLSFLDRDCQLK